MRYPGAGGVRTQTGELGGEAVCGGYGAVCGITPPKYRHPENPELTWSGRGQMPRWLRELVDAGHDKEAFRIRD
ncbi:H-NS histone family protein [Methylomarinovum tepidoasis]|uniref:H-NS histone family protein n=1 Tax=Methylomarinovum tepidoasis TaxID=2840183 RepID=UPI00257399D7|nr:H-NS histone family protein [Methylomarinovum sp. IN45]